MIREMLLIVCFLAAVKNTVSEVEILSSSKKNLFISGGKAKQFHPQTFTAYNNVYTNNDGISLIESDRDACFQDFVTYSELQKQSQGGGVSKMNQDPNGKDVLRIRKDSSMEGISNDENKNVDQRWKDGEAVCRDTGQELLLCRHPLQQFCHHKLSENKNQLHQRYHISQVFSLLFKLNQPTYNAIAVLTILLIAFYFYHHVQMKKSLRKLKIAQEQKEALVRRHQIELKTINEQANYYEVYWDKLICKIQDKKCYDHLVFQGRFLNQPTYVYAVKLEGTDIVTVQRKLNKLLNCSHSRLSKLYFYTKTDQYLLAFTEKINSLSSQTLPDFLNFNALESAKRSTIIQIIQTIAYLQQKIQLKWLPLHSIEIQCKQKKESASYEFKINSIPCLFRKMSNSCGDEDNDTCSEDTPCFVRHNIAALFHLILMNGEHIDVSQLCLNQTNSLSMAEDYRQFLQFILYEAKAIGHTHELLFREVKDHPFLWTTNRKILFLSDFSNFIETHLDEQKRAKMQEYASGYNVVQINWSKPLHFLFAQEINNYRKYDFQSVKDLVRMIRNKINHFHEIPKQVRVYVGKTPQRFMEYCLEKFPKLLYFAYNYTRKKKWKLHMK